MSPVTAPESEPASRPPARSTAAPGGAGPAPGARPIRFDDGAAYERYMGVWSQLAGDVFLDWLAPEPGLRWLDVGCGTGAFTETVVARCSPSLIEGVDPAEGQIAFARTRIVAPTVRFRQGDAQSLPYPDDSFDLAVMPLVIFFLPEPARGVAEMVRVVRAGGRVAAYGWDLQGGGFPYSGMQAELRALGVDVSAPPSPEAAGATQLQALWRTAGLLDIATREIVVERRFVDFEDYWKTVLGGPSIAPALLSLTSGEIVRLKETMRGRYPPDAAGRIVYSARANAISGRVPG